jgi:hypothetical protein
MKFGSLPPLPKDDDFSKWCPNDALEIGDQWVMAGFIGSCSVCPDGQLKGIPEQFLVQFTGNTADGTHHRFIAIEIIRCSGCGNIVNDVSVLCQSKDSGIDVSKEFGKISK